MDAVCARGGSAAGGRVPLNEEMRQTRKPEKKKKAVDSPCDDEAKRPEERKKEDAP